MGTLIERFQDISQGDRKLLFFGDELHVGTDTEDHKSILVGSSKSLAEIVVAGGCLRIDDILVVGGRGSSSLHIESRNPAPVIDYIKSLPDSAGKNIISQ